MITFEILEYLMNLWADFPFFHVNILIELQDLVFTDFCAFANSLSLCLDVGHLQPSLLQDGCVALALCVSDGCECGEQCQAVLC